MLATKLRSWLERRRADRAARRLVREIFRSPELLEGTSLKPRHASRWVLLDREADGDEAVRIWFGILRHPRPYAFSRQSHKVIECYRYDVREQRVRRVRGHNLTRARGRDADD